MRIITMKLIRHLLSHLLLISVIAGVCAVYFYRNQILPEKYVQQIDHYATAIHPKLITIASTAVTVISSPQEAQPNKEKAMDVIYVDSIPLYSETIQVQNIDKATQQTSSPKINISKEKMPEVITQKLTADEDLLAIKTEGTETKESIEVDEISSAETNNVNAEHVLIKEENSDNRDKAAATDKEAADADGLLKAARVAFNKGQFEIAIEKYNELVELENDEADFYGELGNVHYAMGSWDKAGVAYYEAATRLIETGQLAQVGYLQRVLQGLDAERAEKLTKQMAKINQGM